MSEIVEEILCESRKTMALRLLKLEKLSNEEKEFAVDLPLEVVNVLENGK